MTIALNTDPYLLFAGCFFIVMGLSVFLASAAWDEYIKLLSKSKALILIGGIINLPVGLFIVTFYNNWSGPAEIVLMVVGILSLLKALLLLTKPDIIQKLLTKRKIAKHHFWAFGGIWVAAGVAMLIL